MIKEIHRVLKRGGILYIDHDMNSEFAKRFRFFLWIYRKFSGRKKKYIAASGYLLAVKKEVMKMLESAH